MSLIVDCGVVPVLMRHMQAPPENGGPKPLEHEVEKATAFALGLLAYKVIVSIIFPSKISVFHHLMV